MFGRSSRESNIKQINLNKSRVIVLQEALAIAFNLAGELNSACEAALSINNLDMAKEFANAHNN